MASPIDKFNPIHQVDMTTYGTPSGPITTGVPAYAYFKNSYFYLWDDESFVGDGIANLYLEYSAEQPNQIEFTAPKLHCYGCRVNGTPVRLFEMNTTTRVYEVKTKDNIESSRKLINTFERGATSFESKDDAVFWSNGSTAGLRLIKDWEFNASVASVADNDRFNNTKGDWDIASIIARTGSGAKISFTTNQLSINELNNGYKYLYIIECVANPVNSQGMLSYYEKEHIGSWEYDTDEFGVQKSKFYGEAKTLKQLVVDGSTVKLQATLIMRDLSSEAEGTPFLAKGVKYKAYNLLRRALLTCDTQLLDNSTTGLDDLVLNDNGVYNEQKSIDFPIVVDPEWIGRMFTAQVQETIFEGKNLWEVLLQLGYYLHAIPYLEFAPPVTNSDGTITPQDKFILKFRQLGDTKTKSDNTIKTSIFTSRNLQDFFTQYDAYVTNLYSPQNLVEEFLSLKTSSEEYLVYNDTAELIASKPILEIVELDVYYDGHAGGTAGWASDVINAGASGDENSDSEKITNKSGILTYVFENSVYQILTSDDPQKIRPAKGNALFYTLGDNKVQGLQYIPPTVTDGTKQYSLKEILRRVFGASDSTSNPFKLENIKYNNLRFRIKYRTQDSLRVSQMRPDLIRFMKNSAYEKYPHHEQFYGQQDKIVDSERFSANLFGKLIRVGNNTYQCNEYAMTPEQSKEAGDLATINGEPYYVTQVENELYPDAILQKVSYSKNFNQLSQIVTIPSEPRFYEVSERSKIRREVRIMEFFELSAVDRDDNKPPKFIPSTKWQNFITSLIFKKDKVIPNYAYTRFMADRKRQHKGSFGGVLEIDQLFPSSEIDRTDPNNISPQAPSDHADCILPLLHFPLHDGIVFEWDMEDNFKAGDFVDTSLSGYKGGSNTSDNAYYALQSLRYVDVMGRADLFRFDLFYKNSFTNDQIQSLPRAYTIASDKHTHIDIFDPSDSMIGIQGSNNMAIALDKDNREELSFNYQINLLHKNQENDDDFITFPNLFGNKDNDLSVCLLKDPQSQFNENVSISATTVLADNIPYTFTQSSNGSIQINFGTPKYETDALGNQYDISMAKCITLYQNNTTGGKSAYICKNISKLPDSEKLQPWYIYPVYSE